MAQLITSVSASIRGKLNRGQLQVKTYTRSFDGNRNGQLLLPDYPVLSITSLQAGQTAIMSAALPPPGQSLNTSTGYGFRLSTWDGNLPGEPAVLEFIGGYFYGGQENIKVVYSAGYGIVSEAAIVPTSPYTVQVQQPMGICCADNGVTYADGRLLVPVTASPTLGQYIPPADTAPGLYTFSAGDTAAALLISYSFVPADLEEACIQLVAERNSMRSRVGVVSQSLGGQETMSFNRGGSKSTQLSGLPIEVESLIMPYVSVLPPALGPLL